MDRTFHFLLKEKIVSENQIGQDGESPVGMPRWVKAFVVAAVILVAAFIVLHLAGLAPKHTL